MVEDLIGAFMVDVERGTETLRFSLRCIEIDMSRIVYETEQGTWFINIFFLLQEVMLT